MNCVKCVTIIWFVVHFSLTILYTLPLNPIKLRLMPFLNETIGLYFGQNWSLFAPNPVAVDNILLAQPVKENDPALLEDTKWYNLSSTFWDHYQKSRVSAYDRLARSQSTALRSALTGDVTMKPLYDACANGDTLACIAYQKTLGLVRTSQIDKLVKIASAFCNDIDGIKQNYKYVAIRIRVITFPKWSERYNHENSIKDFEIGMYPIDKKIVPIGLFY